MEHNQFVQLYGGIIAELPDDNIAKEADHVPKARRSGKKKAAMSPNNEDDGKKGRRGRPRVDPQDQSAVEVGKPNLSVSVVLIVSSGAAPKSDLLREHIGNVKRQRYPSLSNGSLNFSKLFAI